MPSTVDSFCDSSCYSRYLATERAVVNPEGLHLLEDSSEKVIRVIEQHFLTHKKWERSVSIGLYCWCLRSMGVRNLPAFDIDCEFVSPSPSAHLFRGARQNTGGINRLNSAYESARHYARPQLSKAKQIPSTCEGLLHSIFNRP